MIKTKTDIRRFSKLIVLLVMVVGLILVSRIPKQVQAATGINEQINYQGRLLTSTGAVVPDGTYNMEFQIIQDGDGCNPTSGTPPCGGTVEWTETRTGSDKVTVKNGYFSVYLGSVTAFGTSVDWNQDTLWLSINIGGTGSPSWDGEMEPFNRLSSTPYALNSKSLGGLLASNFIQLAQGSQIDASTASSIYINKTGASGNILELEKNGSDVLVLDNSGGLSVAGTQTITSASASAFVVGANGGTNPAFKIDASTASSATGISVTSKAAAAGVNLAAISSGTNEALSIDAKGSGALNLGNTSTGDILLGGGSSSTGCTVTNSTGAFACTSTLGGSNFSGSSSGTNTGDQTSVSGNAGTATALQTPRTINGVSFDGTANITVTAAAGTLTGTTLASGVTASSLTSVGTLTGLSISGTETITSASATAFVVGANGGTNPAIQIDASTASSATGLKIKSAAAAGGIALSAISSGTDEALSLDAKGAGALNLGNNSTGDILIGGGSGSTGCTVTNSTGALACTSTLSASNFSGSSSGTNTGDQTSVSGNAGTATALQTARTIGGVSFDGTANITVASATGGFTVSGGTLASGNQTITSTSANALAVGANGTTNPALKIDASTASSATGISVTSKAAASGVNIAAISSGTNEALSIDAKGSGALNLGNTSTGDILLGGGSSSTGCTVTNSSGAFACTAGLSGTSGTFTSAIAANGGITFDNSTDTVGAFTAAGTIDMNANILTNIGNSGTDFVASTGALTLAGVLTANGGVTVAGGQNLTMSSGSGTFTQTFTGTTTDALTITASSLTSGTALTITGPSSTGVTDHFVKISTDVGSASSALNVNPDFSGSAVTGYGIYNIGTDSTANANLDYGYYGTLTLTGNAAKAISGIYQGASTSSTTADTIALINVDASATGIITTGTRTIYGVLSQPSAGAESTGGITNVYGGYFKPSADVGAGGTVNGYGLYVANGTYDTDGTSTNTGLYVETPSGADNNYAAIFAGGNVGIGIANPSTKLHVDAGATSTIGLTVNGRIQVNGVAGASATTVCRDGSGVLSTCSSSRAYKKDITYLTDDDYERFLNDVLNTNVATFYYPDDSNKNTRLGIIAEESPAFLQYTDELGMTNIDFYSYQGGYTWASIHALNAKIEKNGRLILENTEGIEMLESRVADLEDQSNDSSNVAVDNNTQTNELGNVNIDTANVALDLNVAGMINANGGLTVNGLAQFNGASIFDQLVTFNGPSLFNGDSTFAGRATFNNDTGGFAKIKAGEQEVHVVFTEPYSDKPVVTVNVSDGQFVNYAYKDLDNNGFTIVLKEPAGADTNFSWSALSIKNARQIN